MSCLLSSFNTRHCAGMSCLRAHLKKPKWRNWQTRVVQVHVLARVWGFESLLRHHFIIVIRAWPLFIGKKDVLYLSSFSRSARSVSKSGQAGGLSVDVGYIVERIS